LNEVETTIVINGKTENITIEEIVSAEDKDGA